MKIKFIITTLLIVFCLSWNKQQISLMGEFQLQAKRSGIPILVVYGEHAPEGEKEFAKRLAISLAAGDKDVLFDILREDYYAISKGDFYTNTTVIAIGSAVTNRLIGQQVKEVGNEQLLSTPQGLYSSSIKNCRLHIQVNPFDAEKSRLQDKMPTHCLFILDGRNVEQLQLAQQAFFQNRLASAFVALNQKQKLKKSFLQQDAVELNPQLPKVLKPLGIQLKSKTEKSLKFFLWAQASVAERERFYLRSLKKRPLRQVKLLFNPIGLPHHCAYLAAEKGLHVLQFANEKQALVAKESLGTQEQGKLILRGSYLLINDYGIEYQQSLQEQLPQLLPKR